MRYAYGLTAALLLGGAAATLTVGPVGAQTAQNEPGTISAASPRPDAPMSFADLAARLQPAVVNISTRQSIQINRQRQLPPGLEEFFRQFGAPVPDSNDRPVTQRGGSLGSGFLISPDGYIVTNNHVVSPARSGATVDEIVVTLADRREFEAELVGRDTATDLAVLKIKAAGLPFVRFGDSTQTRVGDWVVAIGNPFGLGGTVTAGIVSAVHRNLQAGNYDRYIQTDASINMGNSGGPMFDLNGNVVGINTALISPTGGNVGLGFAIPAEQARPVIDALRKGERPQRGYIGVSLQPLDDAIAESLGVPKNRGELIRGVTPGGGAERAGIEQGDVVISVDGKPVTPEESLAYLVANLPVGAKVPFELIRDGQRRTVTVTIGERPTDEELAKLNGIETETPVEEPSESQQSSSQRSARENLGITVQPLTPQIARSLRLRDETIRGVVVASVNPSSDAATKIQQGDIILSINQRATRTPDEAAAALQAARTGGRDSVLLLVQTGNTPPRYVGVELLKR
ncbi:Do family serine endopeptidase [Sphingosinicella rhizophila]|uniref:Probable periplasmic serine endoprotease DegP-like n=1 Tax=Sphingosinicella rhizophila TaxID=3050082 RepID=A0ABU3Q6P4_9SPHN|nr:Do family serine endopeptidase [Sphingosinicella sp. GR2756]MDT9599070.1 Do family serine endopeptidase [Sphingosinicella sp. GR2756]